MIKTGTVIETNQDVAKVMFARSSACGENCAGCGACSRRQHISEVKNTVGAKAGDKVCVTLSDKSANSALFLIFILPVILFVLIYCLIFTISKNYAFSAVISVVVLALYAYFLKKTDKRLAPMPEITQILPSGKDETDGT